MGSPGRCAPRSRLSRIGSRIAFATRHRMAIGMVMLNSMVPFADSGNECIESLTMSAHPLDAIEDHDELAMPPLWHLTLGAFAQGERPNSRPKSWRSQHA